MALIRFMGTPHIPKPPTSKNAPFGMSLTASAADL